MAEQRAIELCQEEGEEFQRNEENAKWLKYDLIVQQNWSIKQEKLQKIEDAKEKERLRIQEEFQAEQDRLAELAKTEKLLLEKKKQQYETLVDNINNYILGLGPLPNELAISTDTNLGQQNCTFYTKTSTCRFGIKCSRNHNRPGISNLLIIPHFFTNFQLCKSKATEYGSDQMLEYDDDDVYQSFLDFFNDTVPEFEKFGKLSQFRVCHNQSDHLRGNVFVEYTSQRYLPQYNYNKLAKRLFINTQFIFQRCTESLPQYAESLLCW